MNTNKKNIIIISVIILIIVGAIFGYRYIKNKKLSGQTTASDVRSAAGTADSIKQSATQGVLPSIGEAANPLTNKPDINPTSKVNPFNSIKTNPFK